MSNLFYFIVFICSIGAAIIGIKRVLKKLGFIEPRSNGDTMASLFFMIVKEKNIFLKTMVTLGVITVLWFLDGWPIPFLNLPANFTVKQLLGYSQMEIMGQPNRDLALLGLVPFFSACIFIQVLSAFIPSLRLLLFGGEKGKRKILYLTYALTAIITILAAFLTGFNSLLSPQFLWGIVTIQVGTTLLFIVLANVINRFGLGNGFAMITAGIVLIEIPRTLSPFFYFNGIINIILFLFVTVLFVRIIFKVTMSAYPIELKHKDSDKKLKILFRPTWLGTEPVSLATSLHLLPLTLYTLFGSAPALNQSGQGVSLSYSPMYEFISNFTFGSYGILTGLILLLILTFLYRYLVFKTSYLRGLMSRYNLASETDPKDHEKNLKSGLTKIFLITLSSLSLLFGLPYFFVTDFQIPFVTAQVFSSTGLVILVGVFYDLRNQLSFFKARALSGVSKWELSYRAFDEIEAEIKKGYLEAKGIPVLIEPLCFTWGMPIRTAVNEYKIYVPHGKEDDIG